MYKLTDKPNFAATYAWYAILSISFYGCECNDLAFLKQALDENLLTKNVSTMSSRLDTFKNSAVLSFKEK